MLWIAALASCLFYVTLTWTGPHPGSAVSLPSSLNILPLVWEELLWSLKMDFLDQSEHRQLFFRVFFPGIIICSFARRSSAADSGGSGWHRGGLS